MNVGMDQFRNKRLNRSVSPLGQHTMNQDCASKLTETVAESHLQTMHPKQFSESPLSGDNPRRRRDDENYFCSSLSEINFELDNNMNEIIYLLGKRKKLVSAKKHKIRDNANLLLQKHKHSPPDLRLFENDEDFAKILSFSTNSEAAVAVLNKIVALLPDMKGSRSEEDYQTQQFWGKNRNLENQIDSILENLKEIDKNLQLQNGEVHEICKELDGIEDHLKGSGLRGRDHSHKIEALFSSKKIKDCMLNKKLKERELSKDQKIELIKRIRNLLEKLRGLRESRLTAITRFFGIDTPLEFESINFNQQFTDSLEHLLTTKEKLEILEASEGQLWGEVDNIERDQEKLNAQILKRQSDEAKCFHNLEEVLIQKSKCSFIVSLFGIEDSSPKEAMAKFKEYRELFSRLAEEDVLIKKGLVKTSQTSSTFYTMLRSIENEKERRHELMVLLETYLQRRSEYEHKKEEMRNLTVQQARNGQHNAQYEEELETVLTDGDIDGYKRIGSLIAKCENERAMLNNQKEQLQRQMQQMDREVVGMANRIQDDFEDLLCDILPSDYQYSLRNSQDVKKLRNYMKKMYKRLDILSQSQ